MWIAGRERDTASDPEFEEQVDYQILDILERREDLDEHFLRGEGQNYHMGEY